MTTVTKTLKKGVAFNGGIYNFTSPLVLHLIEHLQKNPEISYDNLTKAVYEYTGLLEQFDNLSLPTGATFKRTFKPTYKG